MTLQTRLDTVPEPNHTYLMTFFRHKSLTGLSETTIANYLNSIMAFLHHYGTGRDLKAVTRNDIEEFILEYRKEHKASSLQFIVVSLRVFFTDLLGEEAAEPLMKGIRMKVPLVKVRDEQLLTSDEIKRMVDACRTERDRALITLLYSSGCRCGEVLGLKVKDVTFSRYGASIHVNGKTGERDVDLFVGVPELKAYYNVHPHKDNPESDFWLISTGETLTYPGLRFLLMRVAKKAGIPKGKKINPHAFRHKRATDCAEFMTVSDMKEMFGWTDGSNMPSVYVHSSRERVAEKLMKQAGIKVPEQKVPTTMIKQCPVCGCINSGNAVICASCNSALEEKIAVVDENLRNFLREHMEEILEYKKEHEKKENNTE